MTRRFVLVGLFFAVTTAGVCSTSYLELTSPMFFNPDDYGFVVRQQVGRLVVGPIKPSGPAASLQTGDEIVSLDGETIRYQTDLITAFKRHQPKSSSSIVVRRDGHLLQLELSPETHSLWFYIQRLIFILVPACFFLMGLFVFLLKPDDKAALLLSLWFGAISNGFPLELYMLLPAWLMWVVVASKILVWFLIPLSLHFLLVFPEESPLLRRFPRLESYLYVPYLLVILPFMAIINVLWAISPDRVVTFSQEFPLFSQATYILGLAYFAGGILSLVVNYRRASLLSRRKVRVILAGTIAGFLPMFIWFFVTLLFVDTRVGIRMYSWGLPAALAAMVLVPPAYAYAILRHQVIPISLIIRRGVQYLLAKNVLRTVIALPVIGLTLTLLANPNRTLSDILFRNSLYFYVTLMIAAAISFLFRKRLNDWIDRKFFREQYNQETILRGLIEEVTKHDSLPEMSRLVSQKVESALHPKRIDLFYREEDRGDLSLGYSSEGTSGELCIPEEFRLLRLMEGQAAAQEFPLPEKNNLPASEKEWLADLGTRLIVPLVGTDTRLAGLFLLGEKKSEVPYTARDRDLLEALARQIALVYENSRLKERVDHERKIKQEVLGRFEESRVNLMKECPRCGACFDSSVLSCTQDGSELTFSMPVERTVEGRYRLERLIGKGGMGAVYEATDLRLNRRVAVKILSSSMFGNRDALRRFEREAQTSARLHHPNIITVYDYGLLGTGGAYLVMELVFAETLRRVIKREGCIDPQTSAELFAQVLEGVKAAHEAGVVHRDLKPDNILISQGKDGQIQVRLLDFGLAKIRLPELADANSPTASMTMPGTVLGTFGYMSPEQLTGTAVDERSDLFSVGVMVIETLTGGRPFSGKTYHELLASILHGAFHLALDSPEAERLDAVLQKCMAKDRGDRFSSAAAMQRELIPAIREYRLLNKQQWTSSEAEDTLRY
jgi:eukaryotic-like serine/threonine-protein kinase